MQCLKKINIFRSKKKSGRSTEIAGMKEKDKLSPSIGEFDEVDLNVTENDVIESERNERKSSKEKVEFEKLVKKLEEQDYWKGKQDYWKGKQDYWTGQQDYWTGQSEGKSKVQKEESLNIAWCGANNFDGKPKCEWNLKENGGLFGGGENGVGTTRRYWGKYGNGRS